MTDNAPSAPAGWYPVVGGGKRFWNGREWTTDVIGAPSAIAEYDALSPTLPAPTVALAPYRPSTAATPPGWYPSPNGGMQWWDGTRWGPLAPPTTVTVRPIKETGITYLFFFLLGGFSAHRFYLGLTGSAIAFNIVWWLGWILTPIAIGVPMVIVGGIWLLVDLFLIPSLVRSANASRNYFG